MLLRHHGKLAGVQLASASDFEKHSPQGTGVNLASGLLTSQTCVRKIILTEHHVHGQRLCLYLLSYIFIERTALNCAGAVASKGSYGSPHTIEFLRTSLDSVKWYPRALKLFTFPAPAELWPKVPGSLTEVLYSFADWKPRIGNLTRYK